VFEANSIIIPAHVVTPLNVRTAPGHKDISQTIDEGPTQPKLKYYPKTIYGTGRSSRVRSFQVGWFDQFKWLKYSQLEDAVYCLPCRNFSFKLKTDYENIFKSTGYINWKNALSNNKRLYRHDNSEDHKQNVITLINYKKK
jgi:hypothetical protein